MNPLLKADNLTKTFAGPAGAIHVLQSVSLSLQEGESLSIRGASGSGKTTLLNLLAGLETPDSGELHWDGQSVQGLSIAQLAKRRMGFIGLIFQSYHLVPEINVIENVLLAQRLSGTIDTAAKNRAKDLLESVGLHHRLTHLPNHLSGGERQRVGIARALMASPRLILADEPTGNLDEQTAESVFDLLMQLSDAHRVGLLLVTHNPTFAARTDAQITLHHGALVAN